MLTRAGSRLGREAIMLVGSLNRKIKCAGGPALSYEFHQLTRQNSCPKCIDHGQENKTTTNKKLLASSSQC